MCWNIQLAVSDNLVRIKSRRKEEARTAIEVGTVEVKPEVGTEGSHYSCLLYTSDAADE